VTQKYQRQQPAKQDGSWQTSFQSDPNRTVDGR
jgi:hypothetical protein